MSPPYGRSPGRDEPTIVHPMQVGVVRYATRWLAGVRIEALATGTGPGTTRRRAEGARG